MLLPYLVTSRARRDLLRLLWVDGRAGSVSGLARRGPVSFAGAHRELDVMRAEGLVLSERAGAALVYRANPDYPRAELVRQPLQEVGTQPGAPPASDAERVRGWLAAIGAPLVGTRHTNTQMPRLEEVLAEGLVLSHRDPAVARALPVAFWRHRHDLAHERLVRAATRRNERQVLGLFLDLTGHLGRDPRWAILAERLRDRRRRLAKPFFTSKKERLALALARKRTPAIVLRWGYLMNMSLERFASLFEKHANKE